MLEHGGNLQAAVARYGIPRDEWLDLSTGINPEPYPVPPLTADAWHRLPVPNPELVSAACAYYGARHLLPVAGTQAAIQALPRLRPAGRVIVAAPSYNEHAHRWQQAGHRVTEVPFAALETALDDADVMVVCNPNNPTGARVTAHQLLEWSARLATRGGWLVVDEAFADTTPQASIASHSHAPGLIVLRSVGKFFGLAGLRLGFVLADATLLGCLAEQIGPWSVSGPAQEIGTVALSDRAWQDATRSRLLMQGERLRQLLAAQGIHAEGTALFHWWPEWPERRALALQQHMAERGIWVRRFDNAAQGIRLGLPGAEPEWQRLEQALREWCVSSQEARTEGKVKEVA